MSDEQKSEIAAADVQSAAGGEEKWEATLVGGNSYTFGGVKFEKGVAKPIDAATKAKLEEKAVDYKVVDGEYDDDGTAVSEPRAKFRFVNVNAPKSEVKAPARQRRATR